MASLTLQKSGLRVQPVRAPLRMATRRSVRVAAVFNTDRAIQGFASAAMSAALVLGTAAPSMADVPHALVDLSVVRDTDEPEYTFEISCGGLSQPTANLKTNEARQAAIEDPANAGMFRPVDKTFLIVTCPTTPTFTKKALALAIDTKPSDLLMRGCPTWPCRFP